MDQSVITSKSRTYVAACVKLGHTGHYFKKFVLPRDQANNVDQASWYFLNRLDFTAYVSACYPVEDFQNVTDAEK